MPVNAYGNEDFSAFFRGAEVGNMLALRRERAQQLQSEAALRAVQERHLAAQADQIAYNLQQAQADKAKEDQDLATASLLHHTLTETTDTTPEQAAQATDQWLLNKNPKLALKVGQARMMLARPEMAQAALESKEKVAEIQADARKYAVDKRTEMLQQKLQGAGLQLEASGKFANRVVTLERQAREAREAGDDQAADDAEREVQLMHEDLARTHPNAARVLKQRMLQNKASEAYKQFLATGMKNKKLKEEADRTQAELQSLDENSPTGPSAPAMPSNATTTDQFKKSGGFKIKVIKP